MLWIAIQSLNYSEWLYFLDQNTTLNWSLFLPGIIIIIIGLIIAIMASMVIPVNTVSDMRSERQEKLVTKGIYGKIRHPLYLASILLLLGLIFIYPFIKIAIFSISFSLYVLIGTYLEEQKLILHYGQEYLDYQKQVGFLLPKW